MVLGSGFKVNRVKDTGFSVLGNGYRVKGLGFRRMVEGSGLRV